MIDDPSRYKINVMDIVNKWGGYSVKGECVKEPAKNAGNAEIRCYINRICPFYNTGKMSFDYVFNKSTFQYMLSEMDPFYQNSISLSDNNEGMYLSYRKVFRHNYIYDKNINKENMPYEEIINIYPTASKTRGADQTRYKDEQTWYTNRSVFDENIVLDVSLPSLEDIFSGFEGKDITDYLKAKKITAFAAQWEYDDKIISDSDIKYMDIFLDYNKSYIINYIMNRYPELTFEQIPEIDKTSSIVMLFQDLRHVQIPSQRRVTTDSGLSVHWKLDKKTQIFEGEDFFVRFIPQARTTSLNNAEVENFYFRDGNYYYLSITDNKFVTISQDGVKMPCNQGVLDSVNFFSQNYNALNQSAYNLWNQAYYIIEMGLDRTYQYKYFIIITERGNPIFLHLIPGDGVEGSGYYCSRVLGKYEEISGRNLINLPYFDIIVRNHLGSIAVKFEGPGLSLPEWTIKGSTVQYHKEKQTQTVDKVDENKNVVGTMEIEVEEIIEEVIPSLLVTPRGRLGLWGGNLITSFSFGPLQSKSGFLSFSYPVSSLSLTNSDFDMLSTFTETNEVETRDTIGKTPIQDMEKVLSGPCFQLPSGGPHHYMFQTLIDEIEQKYVFTQDAQFFKEFHEISPTEQMGPPAPGETQKQSLPIATDPRGYTKGFFFDVDENKSKRTLREFSNYGDQVKGYKTSNISLKREFIFLGNEGYQSIFKVSIGMMAGDHIFKKGENTTVPNFNGDISLGSFMTPDEMMDIPEDLWLLSGCKTPIITSITTFSDHGVEPRWEDATDALSGITLYPEKEKENRDSWGVIFPVSEKKVSPYFIDASDHVLSYSENWSADGFSEVSHTGTISFYLNKDNYLDLGVTEKLESLRDKYFYIEIWAGYRNDCTYTKVDGLYKLFTGICKGGIISKERNKNIMSCKIEDYTTILKTSMFFNSPWYDGMKHEYAVKEIFDMCSFRNVEQVTSTGESSAASNPISDPGGALVISLKNKLYKKADGRWSYLSDYVLPSGYARLEQPKFKFSDGEFYYSAIEKISKMAGCCFYFDQFGVARYEDFQDFFMTYITLRKSYYQNPQNDLEKAFVTSPIFQFTTNPELFGGQLVFNTLETGYEVDGIVNHLKMISNTPDFHPILADVKNYKSLENPNFTGFIGYLKTAYQQEGMFGSKESVKTTLSRYSLMFEPKRNVKFETYGIPLIANDIISLDGEVLRVINVEHSLNGEKKDWYMHVECMMYGEYENSISGLTQ